MNDNLSLFNFEEDHTAEEIVDVQKEAAADLIHSREQVMQKMARSLNMENDFEVTEEEKSEKKIYQKTEIFPDVVKYFGGDDLAAGVWIDK